MLRVNKIRKTKYIALLLIVVALLFVVGCLDNNSNEDTITVLDLYEKQDGYYNATGDVYNKTISQFEIKYPEIKMARKTIRNEDYYENINSYATMEKGLSDVFVLPASLINEWIVKGAICPEQEYIYPLSNINRSIIVYDKYKWKNLGAEPFPDNWEDIINVKEEKISIGDMSGGYIRGAYLTPYTYMCCGAEWVDSLNDESSETSFIDGAFIKALEMTKYLCDKTLGECDLEKRKRSIDMFLSGDVSAAVITTDEMYELREIMMEEDPKRYAQLGFSFIPVNIEKCDDKNITDNEHIKYMTTTEISTVLVINSEIKDNPNKLAKCVKFCEFMSGQAFADNMAEMFGFECENKSDKTYALDDAVWSDMLQLIDGKYRPNTLLECKNLGLILKQRALYNIDELLWQWIKEDEYTVEEIANYFQDYYE